jgi:hypothetical protein
MIRQVKQMMGVGLRFGLEMLGFMKLVPVILVPVMLVPVILVPVKAAADTTVIIDDVMSLRFARGSFNVESFEGELHDFTLVIDGEDILTGAYLMIDRVMASEMANQTTSETTNETTSETTNETTSETADNPDVVFIRELEMRDLRLAAHEWADQMEVTIERITGRNLDFSMISNADVLDGGFTVSELLFVDEALFHGPSLFRIDGIKARAGDTSLMVESFIFEATEPVELPGGFPLSLEADVKLEGARMMLPPHVTTNDENNEYVQKIYAELHRRHPDGIRLEFWAATRSRLVGEAVQTAVDVTLSLEGLYDLEYGVDFAYRMDVFERMEAISFDKDEDDPEKILAALTPLLEVMELDRIWLELSDQGLLDFVVWSAKQAREEETITDADLRLLGADIVPSLVRGIEPLNKPEAIVALQNFVLNGGMISIDVLPLMTGNMAWLNEAFIAGHMPINVDVMHRY